MTAFFNKSLNLHITSTTIRSLMETHADKMMKRGEITEEERTAVMTINGHSSSTTRNYYIRQDRAANIRNSRAIFGRLPETENTQSRSVSTDTGNNNLLQLGQENDRSSSDNGDDFFEMDLDSNHQPLPVHQFVRFFFNSLQFPLSLMIFYSLQFPLLLVFLIHHYIYCLGIIVFVLKALGVNFQAL
jgi:hypothetical protein